MRELSLGFMDDAILRSDLVVLEALDEQIGLIEEKIAVLPNEDPQVRLLITMTGVGYFSVMLLLAEIGDINRFSGDKRLASWAGLASRVHQSGEKIRIGGMSGAGNKRVRWVMVQCAHSACRFDPRLRGFYKRYSKRRGSKKAVVAVAHEMIHIVFFMLKRGETYRGERKGVTERKFKNLERMALNGLRN